jgi:alpha-L-rhamnosidase
MNSFNHYAYGAVGNWLYTDVAGIRTDEENPGYKYIIINPHPVDTLKYARAEYRSMYGKILSGWEYQGDHIKLHIVIPPNTRAKVFLPASKIDTITESGASINKNAHIKYLASEAGKTIVEIGSGEYNFAMIVE